MSLSSRTIGWLSSTLCLVALAAVQYPAAQTPAPPAAPAGLLHLTVVDVKPDMMTAYAELIKSTTIPALQKAGVKSAETWRTAIFGNAFEMAHVTEIADMAQFDGQSPMREALGPEAFDAYMTKIRGMVTAVRSYVLRPRPDLSYFADPAARPKMAILTNVETAADQQMPFEAFLKGEWLTALKKGGGTHYAVSQVLYGGSATEYVTLVGVDSFAEIGKGHPVQRALGEQGLAKLLTRNGGFTHRIERRIIRRDPELSFQVGATTSR